MTVVIIVLFCSALVMLCVLLINLWVLYKEEKVQNDKLKNLNEREKFYLNLFIEQHSLEIYLEDSNNIHDTDLGSLINAELITLFCDFNSTNKIGLRVSIKIFNKIKQGI